MEPDANFVRQSRQDLAYLVHEVENNGSRPCPGCVVPCACSGSPTCGCRCSAECEYAPRQMSSDPDDHPIEPGIVGLVYALETLRVCQPCWSCEGHNDPAGALHKLPKVWFFARSVMYPDLIAEYLADLDIARKLASPWQVRVVRWDDALATAYSIEPRIDRHDVPPLGRLRADIRKLSRTMKYEIAGIARRRIAALDRFLRARR